MASDINSIQKHIDLFFDATEPKDSDVFSSLNLLRRHKNICLNEGNAIVWPGVMVILAGIDMLGYYFQGGKLVGTSKSRFI